MTNHNPLLPVPLLGPVPDLTPAADAAEAAGPDGAARNPADATRDVLRGMLRAALAISQLPDDRFAEFTALLGAGPDAGPGGFARSSGPRKPYSTVAAAQDAFAESLVSRARRTGINCARSPRRFEDHLRASGARRRRQGG